MFVGIKNRSQGSWPATLFHNFRTLSNSITPYTTLMPTGSNCLNSFISNGMTGSFRVLDLDGILNVRRFDPSHFRLSTGDGIEQFAAEIHSMVRHFTSSNLPGPGSLSHLCCFV